MSLPNWFCEVAPGLARTPAMGWRAHAGLSNTALVWHVRMQQRSLRGPRDALHRDRDRDQERDLDRDRVRDLPHAPRPPLSPARSAQARTSRTARARAARRRGPALPRQRELEACEGSAAVLGSDGFFPLFPGSWGFVLPEGLLLAPRPWGSVLWLLFWGAASQNELHGSVALLMGCPSFFPLLCGWKTSKAKAVLSANRALCCWDCKRSECRSIT